MRTSIILDDELAEQLRARARAKGQSLSAFLADAGRAALRAESAVESKPFEVLTRGEGQPYIAINLDKYSELLAAEDEEKYGRR
ncbi:MAG TPA: ribbon-helix-helix protein, CopG family [Oceanipulchritudo sp.]|nr:ribbon-helix-helix protein, CopG family [Oceanipulchritudo sp.]